MRSNVHTLAVGVHASTAFPHPAVRDAHTGGCGTPPARLPACVPVSRCSNRDGGPGCVIRPRRVAADRMRTVIITILINRGIAGAVAVGAVDVYVGEVGAGMGAVGAGMGTGGAGGKCVVLQAKFRIQRYQIKLNP